MKSFIQFTESTEFYPLPYHAELNPVLWEGQHLKPEVRAALLKIAYHFAEYINDPLMVLHDITISGSNAAYNYSPSSDLDLHLVVDFRTDDPEEAELYDAKKNQYNSMYNIKVRGVDVEVYVQDSTQPHYSAGIYSILHDEWVSVPKPEHIQVSFDEVERKAQSIIGKIQCALQSNDLDVVKGVLKDLKKLRTAGLEHGGEFSLENLAFKMVRNHGDIDALRKYAFDLQSRELSLEHTEIEEQIKGWKHAHSDIAKIRSARSESGKTVHTVKLNKSGVESKMHDAKRTHSSVEAAERHHEQIKGYNPTRSIAHNLYVDGKFVKKMD